MPELPEVESVLRALRDGQPALTGRIISRAIIVWNGVLSGCYADAFQTGIQGAEFTSINRHGKYLIFSLGQPESDNRKVFLIVHLRMTGRLYLVPHDEAVDRHTRLSLLLDKGLALRFDDPRKFGRVWLVQNTDEVLHGLGPDALTVGLDYFASKLSGRSRQIKPLLLDQSFVAGIGNIYADESLFRARIHPLATAETLSGKAVEELHRSIVGVLSEAVAEKGANVDGVFKEGNFDVKVYGRTGEPCRVCGSAIAKIRVGQRGTHFCPICQSISPNVYKI